MKPSHNLCYQWFDDVMIFVSGARSSKVLFIMCISTDYFEINRSIRRWTDSKLGHIASYTFVDITLVCHQYLLWNYLRPRGAPDWISSSNNCSQRQPIDCRCMLSLIKLKLFMSLQYYYNTDIIRIYIKLLKLSSFRTLFLVRFASTKRS